LVRRRSPSTGTTSSSWWATTWVSPRSRIRWSSWMGRSRALPSKPIFATETHLRAMRYGVQATEHTEEGKKTEGKT